MQSGFQFRFLVFQLFCSLEQVICKDAFFDRPCDVGKAVLHFIVLCRNRLMVGIKIVIEFLHLLIHLSNCSL